MADDNIQEFQLDLGNSVAQAIRLANALGEIGGGFQKLTGGAVKFNSVGEQVGYNIDTLLRSGDKLKQVFGLNTLEDGTRSFFLLSQAIQRSNQDLKDATDSLRAFQKVQAGVANNRNNARNETEKTNVSSALRGGLNIGAGNTAEVKAVDAAISKIVANIGKAGITAQDLNSIFARLTTGATEFNAQETKIVAQFQALIVASENLGATQRTQAANEEKIRQTASDTLRVKLNQVATEARIADAQARVITEQEKEGAEIKRQIDAQGILVKLAQERATARNGEHVGAVHSNQQAILDEATRGAAADTLRIKLNQEASEARLKDAQERVLNAQREQSAEIKRQIDAEGVLIKLAQVRADARSNEHVANLHADQQSVLQEAERAAAADTLRIKLNQEAAEKRIADARQRAITAQREIYAEIQREVAAQKVLIELAQVKDKTARKRTSANNADVLNTEGSTQIQNAFSTSLRFAQPTQIIAFNAAMAEALKLLNSGKVNLQQFQSVLQNVRTGNFTTSLNADLNNLQSKLFDVKNSFDVTGKAGAKAGSDIFLSWQSTVRIFEAQILYSVFGQLQQGFSGATQAAADYSRQIALIQTISQDSGVATDEWAAGVRRLSDQLGLPIADTAAAAYEALSNQVAKGADAFSFLATAGDFARTTGSKLEDSVDLLSSALNSFELDATQAGRAAKSFFTTIDLGRVKTPDLANSFGRSGVLAHQLGISLEELNASISTLTRQGIKPNEAYTLLNNVFQKLIKPTQALEEFFKEIGVASGEAAIQTYGYIGVLELLDKKFKGSASEASKYFDEIRGGRGIRNLTGSGLDQVKNDLAKNLNSGDNFSNAKDIVNQSSGQKFEEETNKIKNFFVQDVGGSFLRAIIKLNDEWFNLSKTFIKVVNGLKLVASAGLAVFAVFKVTALIGQVTALYGSIARLASTLSIARTAYSAFAATSAAATATAGAGFAVLTGGVSALVGALVAVGLLFLDFGNGASQALEELTSKFQEAADERIRTETEASAKTAEEFAKGLNAAEKSFLQFNATIRTGLQEMSDNLREQTDSIGDSIKAQFDLINGLARNSLSELENALKKTQAGIDKLKKDQEDNPEDYNRKLFERNVEKNQRNVEKGGPDKTLELYKQRIDELDRVAVEKLQDGDVEAYIKLFDEAEVAADKLAKTVVKIPHFEPVTKTQHDFGTRDKKNPTFPGQQQRIEVGPDRTITTRKKIGTTKTLPFSNEGEKIANDLRERRNKLDEYGIALGKTRKAQQEQELNDARKTFEQLQESQKNLLKFSVVDKKGNLKKEFQDKDGEAPGSGAARGVEAVKKKQDEVSLALTKLGASLDTKVHTQLEFAKQIADLELLFDKQQGNTKGVVSSDNALSQNEKSGAAQADAIAKIRAEEGKIAQLSKETADNREAARVSLQKQLTALEQIVGEGTIFHSLFGTATPQNSTGDAASNITKAQELAAKPTLTEADVAELKQTLIKVAEDFDKGAAAINEQRGIGNTSPKFLDRPSGLPGSEGSPAPTVGNAVNSALQSAVKLQGAITTEEQLKTAAEKTVETLKQMNTQVAGLDPKFLTAATAASSLNTALNPVAQILKNLNEASSELTKSLETNIGLSKQISVPNPTGTGTGSTQNESKGGRIGYYAQGGFVQDFLSGKYARGTDTRPAMLTEGEYVMDKANTQAFLPTLRSMSAGKFKPGGSSQGASTTHVGDIHITVQGGSTSQQTVKEIGNGLRRAVRQGTVKLTKN